MPRTKIKNSKRNREAANREEKIRIYEMKLDATMSLLDQIQMKHIEEVDAALAAISVLTPSSLAQMKVGEFLTLGLQRFADYKPLERATLYGAVAAANASLPPKDATTYTRSDEGYLTEDSVHSMPVLGGCGNALHASRITRTPGPLTSARARRARRSRSACGTLPTPCPQLARNNSEHSARPRLRTPLAQREQQSQQRPKAYSADRTPKPRLRRSESVPATPPAVAYLRWPRPGEIAISKSGSPLVAQVMPEKIANINIPIKDGVISLRPKRLDNIAPEFVENIDPSTLAHLRTLQQNLDMIMSIADKSNTK